MKETRFPERKNLSLCFCCCCCCTSNRSMPCNDMAKLNVFHCCIPKGSVHLPNGFLRVLLILLTLHDYVLGNTDNKYAFITHLADLIVKEANSATFACVLKSDAPFSSASVHWENGWNERIARSASANILTTTNPDAGMVTSRLVFHEVQRDLDGYYKCTVLIQLTSGIIVMNSSNFARLNVQYFLNRSDMHCRGPNDLTLYEGEKISLECRGIKCNPLVDLTWVRESTTGYSDRYRFLKNSSALFGHLKVTREHHNDVFFCVASSIAFPGITRNCSVGPFKILHAPAVQITSSRDNLLLPIYAEVHLTCQTSAYPKVKSLQWLCSSSNTTLRCDSLLQTLVIRLDLIKLSDALNISCTARNFVGDSQNFTIVTVNHKDYNDVPMCKYDGSFGSLGVLQPDLYYEYVPPSSRFTCLIEMSVVTKATFRWYFDGYILAEQEGVYGLIDSPTGKRHVVVQSSIEITQIGIIACDINLPSSSLKSVACRMVQPSSKTTSTSNYTTTDVQTGLFRSVEAHTNSSLITPYPSLMIYYTTNELELSTSFTPVEKAVRIAVSIKWTVIAICCLGFIFASILIFLSVQRRVGNHRNHEYQTPGNFIPMGPERDTIICPNDNMDQACD